MLDRNNMVEKNRRTVMSVFAVLILWCIFTLFVCYTFTLFLHTKFEEDAASKTAAITRDLKKMIRDNVRSVINEEIQKIKGEKCANLVVRNDEDVHIQREWISSSILEQTTEDVGTDYLSGAVKPKKEKTEPAGMPVLISKFIPQSPTIHPKINRRVRRTDNELRINNAPPQSRISKRYAEVNSSSVSMPVTNSVETSNQFSRVHYEHDPDEGKQNRTPVQQNSRLKYTFAKSDEVEVRYVPPKSKKNDGRSRAINAVDAEDEDDCDTVASEHDPSPTNLKSGKLKNDDRKLCPSSKLIEETRSAEVDVLVAAHFGADSSPFKGQEQYYKKNDLVRHPTGNYREWKPSSWYSSLQMFKYVNLMNGNFIIQKKGLYFVYGQMYFTEWTDVNGFVISKNNETVLQCVSSIYGDRTKGELSNTCFTGGLMICKKGDELSIRGIHPGRLVVLEPTKSFFGMFKLNDGGQIGF